MPAASTETIRAAIEGVLPDFRVTDVVARAGGEVNAVYEIRGDGDPGAVILKIYADRLKLAKEAFVYRLLARHGCGPVPRVLHAAPAGAPALPSAFAVLTRLGGEPLALAGDGLREARDQTDAIYQRMGQLLAAVHRIAADRWGYLITGIVDVKPTNTAYMLDQFATKLDLFAGLGGDAALAAAIRRHVDRHAEVFAGCRRPALCHNDFHAGNVLVTRVDRQWQISGYVDVENAVVADPLLDVARTDYYALRDSPAKRRAFLRGYGPLPADGTERIALYQLHHALEFWNWSAAAGRRALLPGIRDDLDRILTS